MSWNDWANHLGDLPEILVGPMLRDVSKSNVSVFLVMRVPYTVTLRVYDGSTVVMKGTATTIQLATHVNVVVVNASTPAEVLTSGKIYEYDVFFLAGSGGAEVPETGSSKLATTNFLSKGTVGISLAAMTYQAHSRPSFALPPASLDNLRLLHGSCRKPHGPGADALTTVDGLIMSSVDDANQRPHLLLLTGDQIYADDVADPLLGMLMQTALALGFPHETAVDGTDLPLAGGRSDFAIKKAQLTAEADVAMSHLLAFSDFAMMYMFVWSNVFWQGADTYPDYQTATGHIDTTNLPRGADSNIKRYNSQSKILNNFQAGLKKVRRALANVPTYMIFDDHEITDDWFMDREWVRNTISNAQLKRIVQNGVAAYAVFQSWGNRAAAFGPAVLAVRDWVTNRNANTEQAASNKLGLPKPNAAIPTDGAYEIDEANAVRWSYALTYDNFQILFLDERTRREYPAGDNDSPGRIDGEAKYGIADQVSLLNFVDAESLFIVVAPAPVSGLGAVEALQILTGNHYVNDWEFWGIRPVARERLLAGLLSRVSAAGGTRKARFALLSGDVHYGFAQRLVFNATSGLAPASGATKAVFAQFTSSAFENEASKTHLAHSAAAKPFLTALSSPSTINGWNNPTHANLAFGTLVTNEGPTTFPTENGDPVVFEVPNNNLPVFQSFLPAYTRTPDWTYTATVIRSTADRSAVKPTIPPVPSPLPSNRQAALSASLSVLKSHKGYSDAIGGGAAFVGLSNVGEITVHWGTANDKFITQDLWWMLLGGTNPLPLSHYVCDLSIT